MRKCDEHSEIDVKILFEEAKHLFEEECYEKSKIKLTHIIDSHANHDSVKEALFFIGRCSIVDKDFVTALQYFNLALEKINIENDKLLFLELMDSIGYCYLELDEYEKALNAFNRGEKYLYLWNESDISGKLWYMFAQGKCLHCLLNFSNSIKKFKEIEKLFNLLSDQKDENSLISVTNFCIGRGYLFLEKINDAAKYLELSNPDYLNESFKVNYYSLMVLLRLYQDEYSKAIEEFQIYKQIGIPDSEKAVVYDWVGRAYYLLKDNENAKTYFKESLKYENNDKKAHEDALAYLEKLSMIEDKYVKIFRIQNILTATTFLFLYFSLRIDLVLSIFSFLAPYKVILVDYWVVPLLISLMISIYLKKWKIIGRKWYSKLELKSKLFFYSMYIAVLIFIVLIELLLILIF